MWRRFGDLAFAIVTAVAVTVEAVPLAYLTWVLLGRMAGSSEGPRPVTVLFGAVASVAMALLMITAYLLTYQFVSGRREVILAERRRTWVARWLRVLFREEDPPSEPLGREAVGALLELRETMRGSEADRIAELLQDYDVATALEREARAGGAPSRLEALDGLARARIPSALPTLVETMEDPERVIRIGAARAAARTLATIEDPVDRDRAAAQIVAALERCRMPVGVVEEILLLSENAAVSLIGSLLLREDAPPSSLRAALDAVARLKMLVFGEESVRFLEHPDAEVRAAALRAVASVGLLPPQGRSALLTALRDEIDFVRIHAAAAARLLPREQATAVLWRALGDRSWWVRRSAGEALADLGPAGLGQLGHAAARHPDRYARDMAAQVLRDRLPSIVQAVAG